MFWRSKQVAINEPVSQPVWERCKSFCKPQEGINSMSQPSCGMQTSQRFLKERMIVINLSTSNLSLPQEFSEKPEPFSNHKIDVHFTFSRKLHQQPAKRIGITPVPTALACQPAGNTIYQFQIFIKSNHATFKAPSASNSS